MNDMMKIVMALVMAYMAWRILPGAIHNLKNGPRGSNNDWMLAAALLTGVMVFVYFLVRLA